MLLFARVFYASFLAITDVGVFTGTAIFIAGLAMTRNAHRDVYSSKQMKELFVATVSNHYRADRYSKEFTFYRPVAVLVVCL